MPQIKQTQQKRNHKAISNAKGLTLLGLMLVLMTAGVIGTIAIHIIRYYTVH